MCVSASIHGYIVSYAVDDLMSEHLCSASHEMGLKYYHIHNMMFTVQSKYDPGTFFVGNI